MDIEQHVPLAPRCTLRVGGSARYLARAESTQDVEQAWRWARDTGVPIVVLGGGSNVVFSDSGVDALVLELAGTNLDVAPHGDVVVDAGFEWDALVLHAVEHDLAGLECLSGIPGRAGAAPIQNIGAYGQEVGESLRWVEAFDTVTGRVERMAAADLELGYRSSYFKTRAPGRFIIVRVGLCLRPGGAAKVVYPELSAALPTTGKPPTLSAVRENVLRLRGAKSMLVAPGDENGRSCGSFFVNPIVDRATFDALAAKHPAMPNYPAPGDAVKLSAAWLIQNSGFDKGFRRGAVGLSTKHTLCLVAHDGATARDVALLARELRAGVQSRFGVRLVAEPEFIGFDDLDDRLPT